MTELTLEHRQDLLTALIKLKHIDIAVSDAWRDASSRDALTQTIRDILTGN